MNHAALAAVAFEAATADLDMAVLAEKLRALLPALATDQAGPDPLILLASTTYSPHIEDFIVFDEPGSVH